jgi:hypothetical protein
MLQPRDVAFLMQHGYMYQALFVYWNDLVFLELSSDGHRLSTAKLHNYDAGHQSVCSHILNGLSAVSMPD